MHQSTVNILLNWFRLTGHYNINKADFEIALLSHPDVGSAAAITDTMTQFGIENAAVVAPFEVIDELTEPFLVYIKKEHEEQFALVNPIDKKKFQIDLGDKKTTFIELEALEKLWTGTIVVIEQKETGNRPFIKTNRLALAYMSIWVLATIAFMFFTPTFSALLYYELGLMGLGVCILIIAQQFGFKNSIGARFCQSSKHTDCDHVLNSPLAKLNKHVGWGDIGIVYFAAQLITLLIGTAVLPYMQMLIFTISLLLSPFIFYSIYLQSFVIKKWCTLCLATVAILFCQGVLALVARIDWTIFSSTQAIRAAFFILTVIALVASIWSIIIPSIKKLGAWKETTIEALSFRRNYHLLFPYLQRQAPYSIDNELERVQIGNPNGSIRILAVTNPLCKNCIELHKIVEALCSKYEQLSVAFIFYVPDNKDDPRTIIASHILAKDNQERAALMQEWYTLPNASFFIQKAGRIVSEDSLAQLRKQKYWCEQNGIFVTPTLLINGRRFPGCYRPTDIQYFIEYLLPVSTSPIPVETSNMVLVDNT